MRKPGLIKSAQFDADGLRAVAGINAFAVDLYKRETATNKNLLISPADLSAAIGLVYRGAVGRTAAELRRVLHFDSAPADYLHIDGQILRALNFVALDRQLRTANAIWLQNGLPLKSDYAADIARYAEAGIQRTDFHRDPEVTRGAINRWVAANTGDTITDLLGNGDVSNMARAVLVSSIYWKGKWALPFAKKATATEPFTLADGQQIQTALMHQKAEYAAIERNDVKAILLPYAGGEIGMAVFLPISASGLGHFERHLDNSKLTRWIDLLRHSAPRDAIPTLPKMKLRWHQDIGSTLPAMGAPTAFSDEADFSGIATLPYPGERPDAIGLKIKHVIHQTFLEVDEESTEAAATTAVTMDIVVSGKRRGPPPRAPLVFRADHPFFFALVDRRSGLILLMGRYVDPSARLQ